MSDGIKSSYELALERLEAKGIERPNDEAFSPDQQIELDQIRAKAKARLAELEILHEKSTTGLDPAALKEKEDDFQRERERIEFDRDKKIKQLRSRAS